jgi:hypothetical protein
MNYEEKKLKALLVKRTLEYVKNHEGRSNKDQRAKLRTLELLQKTFEGVSMENFSKDQKEYFKLKRASERMHERFREHSHGEAMVRCHPRQDLYRDMETMNESRVYLLIEILEGKHNEFLQQIIDRSKNE